MSEDGNDLVYSTRVSINGASCIIYRLRYAAKVYNSSFELRDTIPAGTKIAITGSSTGEHHNEVMPIR